MAQDRKRKILAAEPLEPFGKFVEIERQLVLADDAELTSRHEWSGPFSRHVAAGEDRIAHRRKIAKTIAYERQVAAGEVVQILYDQYLRFVHCFGEMRHCLPRTVGIPMPSDRSEEHPSELQSLMRISYAVFCLKKKH